MKNIEKICEWSGESFFVDYKHRHQRFINRSAMYAWRKNLNREFVKCLNCGELFERYIRYKHRSSNKPTQFCSNNCHSTSIEHREMARCLFLEKNPMNDKSSVLKIKKTKLEKYGDENYNNTEKFQKTCFDKYGVTCPFDIPTVSRSNGRRISKFQKRVFDETRLVHEDAILEHYLKDVCRSVDIFIPSKNLIVECYGDYWHCNPDVYQEDFYNKSLKLTAKETWDRDSERVGLLKSFGYEVDIVWENHI